jgi:NTP pyrophosphatase (non-canonical NTP hydrolase)
MAGVLIARRQKPGDSQPMKTTSTIDIINANLDEAFQIFRELGIELPTGKKEDPCMIETKLITETIETAKKLRKSKKARGVCVRFPMANGWRTTEEIFDRLDWRFDYTVKQSIQKLAAGTQKLTVRYHASLKYIIVEHIQ